MDFAALHGCFRRNAAGYPAILQVLAAELDVSVESLQQLGVGYAPVVEFTKGRNTQGWWTTAERNEQGDILGLSLRCVHDGSVKPMYLASKHGLIYPVRPDYNPQLAYEGGAHNWVRTTRAGLSCPVCDKPDGCLLAADNPEDPKAVICIRVSEDADRPMDFGWLHVLKPEGKVSAATPLLSSEFPVVVVEGMSDAAAVLDLGMVAVGRASASYTKGLPALLKGRHVIVVGENDEPDKFGRRAGLEGLVKTFDVLQPTAASVLKVLPPPEFKDFRRWKSAVGLTRDGFLEYVHRVGSSTTSAELLPSADPLPVANLWLRDSYWDDAHDLPVLRSYGGVWYVYDGIKYVEHKDENALRGEMYRWMDGRRYLKSEDEIASYVPTRARVNDVLDALNATCPVVQDPPSWLDGAVDSDPRNTVVFSNGVLHVNRYLAGDQHYLTPLTPAFFTLNALPYAFDPEAKCPTWVEYLDSTFGTDDAGMEKRRLLQEWFGYNMVTDMSMEKMLIMIGASGSGKGTALTAFSSLIGKHQIAAVKLRSLSDQFGLEPLVGMTAALMSDLRMTRTADPVQALETLLEIIGGDPVPVPRKHKKNLSSVYLTTRFTIAANELPELPDHSQALARRLTVIHFDRSFVGREDTTLKERLPHEAPGMAVWALEGLARLREQGKFTEPSTSDSIKDDFRKVTSPVTEFAEDCCLFDETLETGYQEMFDIWAGWAVEHGIRPGHRTRFQQRILAAFPSLSLEGGLTRKVYKGVQLNSVAVRKFS